MDVTRQELVHLIVGEVALLFAGVDQLLNIVVFEFNRQVANLQ
jgi:hypothetical protein